MRNVFLLYMPPGNREAMVHYEDTIVQKVPLERIAKYVSQDLRGRLQDVFGPHRIAVWGSASGPANRGRFDRMGEGDDLLIVEGNRIKMIGKIAAKTVNGDLSRELWQPLQGRTDSSWELIYFIANSRELDAPFSAFCKLFGYEESYQLRGFTSISEERLATFFERYDDLYSVLVRLKQGWDVAEKIYPTGATQVSLGVANERLAEIHSDDIEQVLASDLVSDHTKMQWKLARLGLKAGEKVWVPASDQARLQRLYQFETFDRHFAAGIDLPSSYVENIDVVWKQEFQIDAAYEIENSTAIYSGLLRFSDLMIVAPNTIYPMFIVAPAGRKNRLREQLRRPTFKRMELNRKVRFLSYEAIDDIDRFFASATSGLNVGVIQGKAEVINLT
jgi:hypothetical protein